MKIATVTITRLGNKYLQEYVEYYKSLGVDKMYFYDNNHEDEEPVESVLKDYVFDGFVEIIPFHDVDGRIQEKAYQDFYDNHGTEFDWIGFFDDDEYVTINIGGDLKSFLSREKFDGRNGVCFPMIHFCDSGVIVNDKNTRLDVYTTVKDIRNIWFMSGIKTIIRGGLNVSYIAGMYEYEPGVNRFYDANCHIPVVDGKIISNFVDCDGNPLEGKARRYWTYYGTNDAFLKHIPTGCIDDYINMKMKRDWPDTNNKQNFGYDYFKTINVDTEEKYKYFLEHTNLE
jgi:hypothetical protein